MEKNLSTSSSSHLRKFLLRLLLPVLIPVVVFCWLFDGYFLERIIYKNQTTGAAKIHRIYHELHPNEIPVFGSSRAAGSYIPDEIMPDCWNYGIEKTQFDMLEIFLKQELAKPKTTPIIINFDYEMFENWFCDIAHLIPNSHEPEIKAFMGDKYTWTYQLPTIRFYGHFDAYYKNNLAQTSTRNYINNGGFFLKDAFNAKAFARQVDSRSKSQQRFHFDIAKHNRLIALIRSHPERKMHIVVAPYHPSFFIRFEDYSYGQTYLKYLNHFPNVIVHDYGKADYADSLFKNTTHLNLEGARKFSRELGKAITGK